MLEKEDLHRLVDTLEEGLIVLDRGDRIIFYNSSATKICPTLFSKPLRDGEHLVFAVNEQLTQIFDDLLRELHEKHSNEKHYAELKNNYDSLVILEFSFIPLVRAGIVERIYLAIRDITQQKVFEKKLSIQAANTTALIEKANAIIIGLDTRGYIIDWNKHCVDITGFSKEEAYAQKFVSILMKDVPGDAFEMLLSNTPGKNGRNTNPSRELTIRSKMGNLVTILLSCTPRMSSNNQVIGFTLVGHDATELTDYRQRLEIKVEEKTRELKLALQKEQEVVEIKNRFISIASHEFRSPLNSIQFQIEQIVQGKGKLAKDISRRLQLIKTKTKHMLSLLDDVLSYEKKDASKIRVDFIEIDLLHLLSTVVEEVTSYTKNSGHRIQTDFRELPSIIVLDENLLRSIVTNLLTNAIKFSPGKEKVHLNVAAKGNQLLLEVSDEGIGIGEDEIEQIFEPFLRGKSVGSIQGTGLGLSIVKKSVELLNGLIQVKSDVGKGTTFSVTLPITRGLSQQ